MNGCAPLLRTSEFDEDPIDAIDPPDWSGETPSRPPRRSRLIALPADGVGGGREFLSRARLFRRWGHLSPLERTAWKPNWSP